MVLWDDECKEVNVRLVNTIQEVDQVTFQFGHQLQPAESVGKEKKKEVAPELSLISANAKENGEK